MFVQTDSSRPARALEAPRRAARPASPEDSLERAVRRALVPLRTAPAAARPLAMALRSLCARGGKRVRPRLCALGYEAVARRSAPPGVYSFAAGVELMHAFMLVHDDLLDDADERRGGPSVHAAVRASLADQGKPARLPGDLALLGGDLLFALSNEAMLSARLPAARVKRAARAVLEGARDAAFGECLDVLYAVESPGALSSAALGEVLRLKTARYTFESPLVAGALLAGADATVLRALAEFGGRVGVAFQLADDLLDLYGDARALGKPVGGDVRQGKRTVVMALTLERASARDAARLTALLDARSASDAEVRWAAALARRTGAAAEVAGRVRRMVRAAQRALARAGIDPAARRALRTMAADVAAQVKSLEEERG